jgi:DNA-binding SARP family transcriptional activator
VFEDEPYAAWAQNLRFTYRPRIIRTLLDVARFRLERGDLDDALRLARRVVDMDPAVEAAYQIEMVACYQVGRQDEAVRSYLRCREILRTELAVEPLDATIELADAVRRHDSAWLVRWSRTSSASPVRRAG